MPDSFFDLLLSFDVERIGLEERHLALALQACRFLHRLKLVQELAEATRVILRCVGEIGVCLCAWSGERPSGVSLAGMMSRRGTRIAYAAQLCHQPRVPNDLPPHCFCVLFHVPMSRRGKRKLGRQNGEKLLSENSPACNRRVGIRICALLPQEEHVVCLDAIGLTKRGQSARDFHEGVHASSRKRTSSESFTPVRCRPLKKSSWSSTGMLDCAHSLLGQHTLRLS